MPAGDDDVITPTAPAAAPDQVGEDLAAKARALVADDDYAEGAAYRLKLSKWCHGAMQAITSSIFWCLLYLCRTLRGPLRHFMLIVQQEARAGECLFKLVTSRLDDLTKEFQVLFANLPKIVDKALSLAGCYGTDSTPGLDASDITKLRYIALRLLLLHWAAFRRRIIRPLQQYPFKMFWLIKAHPKKYCAKRMGVARELLQLPASQLDASTLKIRTMCERELIHIRDHGVFPDVPCVSGSFLYAFLKGLAKMLPADTQAIEGINSVIKLVGKRCPNISLELLSSRLVIRRSLSESGSMRRNKKWSSIKGVAEGLLASILGYNTAALSILANDTRWSSPMPVDCGPDSCRTDVLALAITDVQALVAVRANDTQGAQHCQAKAAEAETQTGAAATSSSSSAASVPQSGGMHVASPEAVAWAKSYNLGWRRATAKFNKAAKRQTTPPEVLPSDAGVNNPLPGAKVAVVQRSKNGHVQSPPSVYLVAEKFSVSVMFSKVHMALVDGCWQLQWMYEEHNCVESTLFMLSFFQECRDPELRVEVGCVTLPPDMCIRLVKGLGGGADDSPLPLSAILQDVKPCFVMSEALLPRPQQPKTKAKTERARGRGRRARGRASNRGRGSRAGASAAHSNAEAEQHDRVGRTDQYLEDANFIDDAERGSHGGSSDEEGGAEEDDLDEGGDMAVMEICAASNGGKELPSSRNVQAKMVELEKNSEAATAGELEEEALLLLIRQARSEKGTSLGVGCSRPAGKPRHILADMGIEFKRQASTSSVVTETQHEASSAAESQGQLESDPESEESDDGLECVYAGNGQLPSELMTVLGSQTVQTLGRDGRVLGKWVRACHKTLVAMRDYATLKDLPIGTDRSISLVLLRQHGPVKHCRCIRCKWNDQSQDIVWVHWLNNSAKSLGCMIMITRRACYYNH